ncbi:MAG: hypothetical protein ABR545_12555, partial [Cyclonatronaceae bacterium]
MELRTSYRFPFSRYPAVRIALLFICGIWLCDITPQTGPLIPVAVVAAWLILYLVFTRITAVKISVLNTSILTLIYLAGILLAGWFRMAVAQKEIPQPVGILLEFGQEPVQVSGRLLTVSVNANGTLTGIMLVDSARVISGVFAVEAQLRYRLFNAEPGLADELPPGTLITGTG